MLYKVTWYNDGASFPTPGLVTLGYKMVVKSATNTYQSCIQDNSLDVGKWLVAEGKMSMSAADMFVTVDAGFFFFPNLSHATSLFSRMKLLRTYVIVPILAKDVFLQGTQYGDLHCMVARQIYIPPDSELWEYNTYA